MVSKDNQYTNMQKQVYAAGTSNHDEQFLNFLSGGWPGQDSPLRNEYLLKWHLIKNNIEVKTLPTLEIRADVGIIR